MCIRDRYEVVATTYQAISGAGKTFKDWPEMVGNIIQFIGGEAVSYTHLMAGIRRSLEYISATQRNMHMRYMQAVTHFSCRLFLSLSLIHI